MNEENSIKLDCDFIQTPRILFNDKKLSRTDIDVLSLIISLTLTKGYCFACNKYLASYINASERTISNSLSKLKTLKYIFVKYEDMKRRIYINSEKIPIKISKYDEKNSSNDVAETCYHNINNEYKKEYNNKSSLPYWMDNPEYEKKKIPNEEEMREFDRLLDEFNDEEGEI